MIQTKILITQTNVSLPSASTVIAVPGTSKRRLHLTSAIHELGRHLQRNRSDAASSQVTSSPSDPDGAFMSTKPALPRETVQSLSNISTSSETDKSGFHLMLHHRTQPLISTWPSRHVHLRGAIYSGTGRKCRLCWSHWMRDTAMLPARQETWNLSARLHFIA
jgi:hypothetical protein